VTDIVLAHVCKNWLTGNSPYNYADLKESRGFYRVQTYKSKIYGILNDEQLSNLKSMKLCNENDNSNALFFLQITVQRNGLVYANDDDYLIDKNCQLIKGPSGSKDEPSKMTKDQMDVSRMITWDELLAGNIKCNINIDGTYVNR